MRDGESHVWKKDKITESQTLKYDQSQIIARQIVFVVV